MCVLLAGVDGLRLDGLAGEAGDVVEAAAAGVAPVTVVHRAGGQPGAPLLRPGRDVLETVRHLVH